ncbi:MAG: hypothetical protein KBD36_06750 [Alphaproteobacteria bacterium]|nr:hypothetical protein [Alphaproteobacteria bacterium]
MTLLLKCDPSRYGAFLSIPDNAMPTLSGEGADLFVGKNKSVTITLMNGTETRFRDVVVLGELILKSSDPENTAIKPKIIARDVFAPAKFSINNINLQCRHFYQPKGLETFRSELQELFTEWLDIQRESVARIGLKSILV